MTRTLSTTASLLLAAVLFLGIQAVIVVAEDTSLTAEAASHLDRRMVPKCVMDCNKDVQERCLEKTPMSAGAMKSPESFV